MGKIQLTQGEKELLNVLGYHPDISMKELVSRTEYKRVSSVVRKIEQFKRQGMLYGSFYEIDYSKLCKNPLRMLHCIIESGQDYNTVMSYLKCIESLRSVYPVLSPHKELANVLFLSSDNAEMADLLQLLTDHRIISDYIIRVPSHRSMIENPHFFGDSNPSLDHLLDPCDIPDLSFRHHETDWNECDIAVLPYLRVGYKGGKLIEILKAERKLNRTWTYEQIKYSHKKMLKNGLIEKKYIVFPFSFEQCTDFNVFLKTEDLELTQRILHNFVRGERVLKEYVLCGDWGYVGFASHPLFLTGFMHKLNKIDEIEKKELYQLRSAPDREHRFNPPPEFTYFDFDEQTLKYPYQKYREKIKETLERDKI